MVVDESSNSRKVLFFLVIFAGLLSVQAWDSIDLELFDVVEEVKDNFYEVLGVEKTATQAEIRRAYRRLSLQFHPDRNKEPDAEVKFRKLVAVAEVLRDEDKRKRYEVILRDGLPDWRQPIYYYRRVRKMGFIEFFILLFFIATIGHYIVAWSIYLEKKFELEELLSSKIKKEEKKRRKAKVGINEDDITELADILVQETGVSKPKFSDLLPLQVYRSLVAFFVSLPARYRTYKEHKENIERMKLEEELEKEAEEQQEKIEQPRPRRRQRVILPDAPSEADESGWAGAPVTNVLRNGDDDNEEMDLKIEKSDDWTEEDFSHLSRAMVKFPGGTPKRWVKIAQELERSVEMVTKQMKRMKQDYNVSAAGTTSQAGPVAHGKLVTSRKGATISEEIFTRADPGDALRVLPAKTPLQTKPLEKQPKGMVKTGEGTPQTKPAKLAPKRAQNLTADDKRDHNVVNKEKVVITNGSTVSTKTVPSVSNVNTDSKQEGTNKDSETTVEGTVWSQGQQKVLELALQQFPKTTPDRWTCIARAVPGMTKEDCVNRYKYLVELVRQKKNTDKS